MRCTAHDTRRSSRCATSRRRAWRPPRRARSRRTRLRSWTRRSRCATPLGTRPSVQGLAGPANPPRPALLPPTRQQEVLKAAPPLIMSRIVKDSNDMAKRLTPLLLVLEQHPSLLVGPVPGVTWAALREGSVPLPPGVGQGDAQGWATLGPLPVEPSVMQVTCRRVPALQVRSHGACGTPHGCTTLRVCAGSVQGGRPHEPNHHGWHLHPRALPTLPRVEQHPRVGGEPRVASHGTVHRCCTCGPASSKA